MQFSHIALNCADQPAAIDFYTRHFGCAVARRLDIGEGREIVFLRRDDLRLELFPVDGPAPDTPQDGPAGAGTLRHLAFQVPDVDAQIDRMGQAAVVTLGPLDFDSFIPGWRTAWLRDPNGHIVEITQGYRD